MIARLLAALGRPFLPLAAAIGVAAAFSSAAAQFGSPSYIGSYGNWEAHVYPIAEDETRCAVRSLHPAIIEGEVHWVFNTRYADRLPDGFLAVEPRLMRQAVEAAVLIDDRARFALKRGQDGTGYSRDEDTATLLAAMRQGIEMDLLLIDDAGGRRLLPISLIGFRRASDAARSYCSGTVRRTLG
ncbi:MAG: hypothetical protein HKM95_11360 [Inquilinus sp.]|nr:hypothetical protein [Inquilinus sp.]